MDTTAPFAQLVVVGPSRGSRIAGWVWMRPYVASVAVSRSLFDDLVCVCVCVRVAVCFAGSDRDRGSDRAGSEHRSGTSGSSLRPGVLVTSPDQRRLGSPSGSARRIGSSTHITSPLKNPAKTSPLKAGLAGVHVEYGAAHTPSLTVLSTSPNKGQLQQQQQQLLLQQQSSGKPAQPAGAGKAVKKFLVTGGYLKGVTILSPTASASFNTDEDVEDSGMTEAEEILAMQLQQQREDELLRRQQQQEQQEQEQASALQQAAPRDRSPSQPRSQPPTPGGGKSRSSAPSPSGGGGGRQPTPTTASSFRGADGMDRISPSSGAGGGGVAASTTPRQAVDGSGKPVTPGTSSRSLRASPGPSPVSVARSVSGGTGVTAGGSDKARVTPGLDAPSGSPMLGKGTLGRLSRASNLSRESSRHQLVVDGAGEDVVAPLGSDARSSVDGGYFLGDDDDDDDSDVSSWQDDDDDDDVTGDEVSGDDGVDVQVLASVQERCPRAHVCLCVYPLPVRNVCVCVPVCLCARNVRSRVWISPGHLFWRGGGSCCQY